MLLAVLLLFGLACPRSSRLQISTVADREPTVTLPAGQRGVTIAVEPLFRDDLAAVVFDKNDIVTGDYPSHVIFNGNDFL